MGGRNSEYTDYTLALGMFSSVEKNVKYMLCVFGIMVCNIAHNEIFDLIFQNLRNDKISGCILFKYVANILCLTITEII